MAEINQQSPSPPYLTSYAPAPSSINYGFVSFGIIVARSTHSTVSGSS